MIFGRRGTLSYNQCDIRGGGEEKARDVPVECKLVRMTSWMKVRITNNSPSRPTLHILLRLQIHQNSVLNMKLKQKIATHSILKQRIFHALNQRNSMPHARIPIKRKTPQNPLLSRPMCAYECALGGNECFAPTWDDSCRRGGGRSCRRSCSKS